MEASSAGRAAELAHERTAHESAQLHHHHTHAATSSHGGGHHLLQVEDLSVSFRMYDEGAPYFKAKQHDVQVLHELSIAVHAGEIVAVVGASGSGKTLLADAVLGLFEPNATVTGRIWFDGERMDAAGLRALRGHGLSLVPQSVSHLDPMMRVGKQVEGFANDLSKAERKTRRAQLFERYGLGPEVARLYPHELSGGMARRVLLCCALMDSPRVIVADEPTPGLDLDLAIRALDDFRAFANEGNGVLLITHDIELAARGRPRGGVQGRNRGGGNGDGELRRPQLAAPSVHPSAVACPPRARFRRGRKRGRRRFRREGRWRVLEARDITFGYPGAKPLYSGFSLQVEPGERVALQAPSGFGKTTLCRVLAGFERPQTGQVLVDGQPLPRRGVCPVQLIQQHPEQAVDPRLRMRKTLAEAGEVPQQLLDDLGIRDEWLQRYPHELSGGELQRFCIARALATRPRYLICDEVSTMLDAVTQAHIWHVLLDYAARENAGMLLVSHTPALTARIATREVALT